MKSVQKIITEYKKELAILKKKSSPFEIVFNSDWDKITSDLKVIYCGDNPGRIEKEKGKYFVGAAGGELELFVSIHNKRLGVESDQAVFFNKTPCHSNKTSDIKKSKDDNNVVHDSIKLTVECLFQIWKAKRLTIIVLGVDESSYIVSAFKKIVLSQKKYSDFLSDLTILHHPSHNALFAKFGKFVISNFENKESFEIQYDDLINATKKDWSK